MKKISKFQPIDNHEVFLRHLHNYNSGGTVIFRRDYKNSRPKFAKVPAEFLSYKIKYAECVPDLYYSFSSFHGLPLVLNFHRTQTLFVVVPITIKEEHEFVLQLLEFTDKNKIPSPSAIQSDGSFATIIWFLETPITSQSVYQYCSYQQLLHKLFSCLGSNIKTRDITSLIRSTGSINSKNNKLVRLIHGDGRTVSNKRMEKSLLENLSAQSYNNLRSHGIALQQLEALWDYRFWDIHQKPEQYQFWLLLFGAALKNLCSNKQLTYELKAIAESLENKKWTLIQHKHKSLIKTLSNSAIDKPILINGLTVDVTEKNWNEIFFTLLKISNEEAAALGISSLPNTNDFISSKICNISEKTLHNFGFDNFEPIDRLLMKSV